MLLLIIGGAIGIALVSLLLYWLLLVGECTYFGRYAVRLIYHVGAPIYDQVRIIPTASDHEVLLPILRAALIDHHGPHVLDVATGTGRVPLLIAGMPGFNGHIDGLDLTPAMLERARKKAHDLYLDASISWHLGEASSLPWAAESFDLVTCLEALEFFPRPRRSLREMVRVLRPGGMLIVSKYPDNWARMLPGKALTRAGIVRLLHRFGLSDVMIAEWQPGHYELVTARFKLP